MICVSFDDNTDIAWVGLEITGHQCSFIYVSFSHKTQLHELHRVVMKYLLVWYLQVCVCVCVWVFLVQTRTVSELP